MLSYDNSQIIELLLTLFRHISDCLDVINSRLANVKGNGWYWKTIKLLIFRERFHRSTLEYREPIVYQKHYKMETHEINNNGSIL